MIRISQPDLGYEEESAVLDVIRSGRLAQGQRVELLEAMFASAVQVDYAVAVNSGTSALFLALEALDLRPGDEVITSPLTFMATVNAILATGATARFADIREDFTIDPDSVEGLLNERTRALVPVHLYGCPSNMSNLAGLLDSYEVSIVEDAAQALGARTSDRPVGSWGTGCFSLYATKNVTTGEGGIVTTHEADLANRLRIARNQGMIGRYEFVMAGYNMRLTELQAALGIPQMKRLTGIIGGRRHNAAVLTEGLGHLDQLRLPGDPPNGLHVYHQYTVEVLAGREKREAIMRDLASKSIETAIYYPRLVSEYPYISEHPQVLADPTPRARQATARVLSLPVHPRLTEADLEKVINAIDGSLND